MNLNKHAKMLNVFLALFLFVWLTETAQAVPIVGQLTDNSTDDINPQVSDGHAVWQGQDSNGGDWEIYFYDGNSVSRLTDNANDDINPQICGSNIVWQGWDGNDWEIFYYDGNATEQLTDNDYNDVNPKLSKSLIIWQTWDGNDWEISAAVMPSSITMKVTPQSLNLKSKGQWITCQVKMTDDLIATDVLVATLRLQGVVPASKVSISERSNQLLIKFDRAAVQALLAPGEQVQITLTGQMAYGAWFEASDMIKVINPGHK
jgi:hypothetical protein